MNAALKELADGWERWREQVDEAEVSRLMHCRNSADFLSLIDDERRFRAEQRALWRAEFEPLLPLFLDDNSYRSPVELQELAQRLSPGWTHDGGSLIFDVMSHILFPDPVLVAAVLYANWHGGKRGFQFLPPASEMSLEDYESEVDALTSIFEDIRPSAFLTGVDVAFYDSLPDRFTVYRGVSGGSVDIAGAGICWTTNRAMAEWFAHRFANEADSPILLSARVDKRDVLLVNNSEFEVVVRPSKAKLLKVGPPRERPDLAKRLTLEVAA